MKYKIILLLLTLSLTSFAKNDTLITSIIKKYSPSYSKFKGLKFKKTQSMIIADRETGEDPEEMKIKADVVSPFYGLPQQTIFYYEKDREKLSVDEYDKRDPELPPYPLFDQNSTKHYRFSFEKSITLNGRKLEKYSFYPLKNEKRYIKGYVLIDKKNSTPYKVKYTMAKTSFPMKSMGGENYFKDLDGALVPIKVSFLGHIHVPIFYPNKKVSGKITFSEQKLY